MSFMENNILRLDSWVQNPSYRPFQETKLSPEKYNKDYYHLGKH